MRTHIGETPPGEARLEEKSRGVEFAKGAGVPMPIFVALVVLAWSVVNPTWWSELDVSGDLPLEILVASCALTVMGLVAVAVRFWNRSRWFAYGVLASFGIGTLLGGFLVVLIMLAMGGAMRG
jgi:hypothetical protein